jgi:hypothetical protein
MLPTITTIPLQHLASGDRLSLQLYQFTGQPGKKVYIQSNLHGGELAGNAVIHQVMEWLGQLEPEQLFGEIWLVPVCNPVGVNERSHHYSPGRFNPYDGENWNRIFWTYEPSSETVLEFAKSCESCSLAEIQQQYRQQIRAAFEQLGKELHTQAGVPYTERYRYQLQSLCLDANYVIDLHTSSDQGCDFLFYFQGREQSAALFLLETAVLLDDQDGGAFDEAFIKPWLALEECFGRMGRSLRFDIEAWTLELGTGMQLQPNSVQNGVRGIKNYLVQQGIVVGEGISAAKTQFASREQLKRYYAPLGGMIQARSPVGSPVRAGDPLYRMLSFNKLGQPPTEIEVVAEQSGQIFDVAFNQAANEGEYVLTVLQSPKE